MRHAGIDLGGTKTEIVVLEGGVERARFRRPTPQGDYDASLRTIAALLTEAERRCGPVATVGIGTPGSVVPETGCMKNCNSTWLNGRPLLADLTRRLERPLAMANDADCFALSEAMDGAGSGADTVFGVIMGTGVGGGIVHRGRLLSGPNGIAGEWGHNPLPSLAPAGSDVAARHRALGGRACWCGREDCIEAWLSGPALHRTWIELGGDAPGATGIARAAAAGDRAAREALDLHGWQTAAALAGVINLLDPAAIVLGGGLSNLPTLYDVVPERWGAFVFADAVRTRLHRARHGDSGGVRGAAWHGRDAAIPAADTQDRS